jgi:AmmeMemoRadiSam system protein B
MRAAFTLCLVLAATACAPADDSAASEDTEAAGDDAAFEQPGLDDDTARMWTKAGVWYPEDHVELDEAVAALIAEAEVDAEPRAAIAILPPHASLRYSGPTGKEVWSRVAVPDTVLILAPHHWNDGERAAIWTEGPWLVPGHALEIDRDLLARVQEALPELVPDRVAFERHETEMLLPWLQYLRPDVKIVPIAFFDNEHNAFPDFDVERIEAFGLAVAEILRAEADAGREVLLIGTTDLVHHESLALSDEQDSRMMELFAALDVQGLHDYVTTEDVSVCGEIPVAIMMVALRELGVAGMEILARGNSMHVNDDDTDVIGYPAAAAWR